MKRILKLIWSHAFLTLSAVSFTMLSLVVFPVFMLIMIFGNKQAQPHNYYILYMVIMFFTGTLSFAANLFTSWFGIREVFYEKWKNRDFILSFVYFIISVLLEVLFLTEIYFYPDFMKYAQTLVKS